MGTLLIILEKKNRPEQTNKQNIFFDRKTVNISADNSI